MTKLLAAPVIAALEPKVASPWKFDSGVPHRLGQNERT